MGVYQHEEGVMEYSNKTCKQLLKVGLEIEHLITCCLQDRGVSVVDILTAVKEGTLQIELSILMNNPTTPLAVACQAQHRDGDETLRLFAVSLGTEKMAAH